MSLIPAQLELGQGFVVNGRYRVMRELGHGGMGIVYLVEDLHDHGKRLALKMLLPDPANLHMMERFHVEFAGLSKLRHPNIAAACDFGRIAGTQTCYFTSEFVTGVDIYRGTVNATTPQILGLFAQTLRGIEVVHKSGYVHNDLKPGNILLEFLPHKQPTKAINGPSGKPGPAAQSLGRVKIIDFGLFSVANTSWSDLLGTPQYLSPERIRGEVVDQRSDLYSLGFIFYALLARTLPFNEPDPERLLTLQLEQKPPSLSFFRPDLSASLIAFVEQLMQKRPGDRFPTAGEALAALEREIRTHHDERSGYTAADLSAGSLVRREREFIALQEQFFIASALARDSSSLVLKGPSGIGKTRLVRELRGLVQVSGGAYIELPGIASDVTTAQAAEAIWVGLETSGLRDLSEARKAAKAASLAVGDSQAIAKVVQDVVLRCAHSMPILLFFDDFLRASPGVQTLALELIRTADEHLSSRTGKPRLLVVLGWRTDEAIAARAALPPIPDLPVLELKPFSTDDSCALIKTLFDRDDIPEGTLSSVAGCAQGIPGRVLELVTDLVENESVRHDGSAWVFPG